MDITNYCMTKTHDEVLLFENYCEKSSIPERGEILTIMNETISPGFIKLTMYCKTSFLYQFLLRLLLLFT